MLNHRSVQIWQDQTPGYFFKGTVSYTTHHTYTNSDSQTTQFYRKFFLTVDVRERKKSIKDVQLTFATECQNIGYAVIQTGSTTHLGYQGLMLKLHCLNPHMQTLGHRNNLTFAFLYCSHNYKYKLLSDKIAQKKNNPSAGLTISCAHYKNRLVLHSLISYLLNYLVMMFNLLKSYGTERNVKMITNDEWNMQEPSYGKLDELS
jgi:hypothetical protein